MDTKTIDKLYLELSQFTKATTAKEAELTTEVERLRRERDFFEGTVQWMSGSADFGVGGKAHKGWLKHQRELAALRSEKGGE